MKVLPQGGVCHGRDSSLPEVVVIQPKNAGISAKTQLVGPRAPGEIVVDKDP